jgi:hypothetical protein
MTLLNPDLVDDFVAGRLDRQGEATLADQVARIMPWHWALPPPSVGALTKLLQHLGGEPGLREWLGRYTGRPQLMARVYDLIALLDRISDRASVVGELRRWRERVEAPPELATYMTPDTNEATLASLAGQIEALFGDQPDEAYQVARAAAAMLRDIAPRVAAVDPDLRHLGDEVQRIDRELQGSSV